MGYIRNPEIAYAIVHAEQHRLGVWADLTGRQHRHIGSVIRADGRGQLSKADIVARLHEIARDNTPPVAPPARTPQGGTCPDCGRSHVPLLIDGRLSAHTVPGSFDRPCHERRP